MKNIPSGHRELVNGEIALATDIYREISGCPHADNMTPMSGLGSGYVNRPYGSMGWESRTKSYIIRKIESPWVAMSERKPKAYVSVLLSDNPNAIGGNSDHGWVGFWEESGFYPTKKPAPTHWMPIPDLPKPVVEPIFVREGVVGITGTKKHEVKFEKNGDVIVGCTKVESAKMDKIIARRKEVMES